GIVLVTSCEGVLMRTACFSNGAPFGYRTRLLSAASVLAVAAGIYTTAAQAQEDTTETVVVTSTRVQRAGYSAPTPETSLNTQDLQQQAASNLGEILTNVPSFAPSASPTTSGVNSLNGGQINANLRE